MDYGLIADFMDYGLNNSHNGNLPGSGQTGSGQKLVQQRMKVVDTILPRGRVAAAVVDA